MDFDKDTALILVDIQKGFDDPEFWGTDRNNPNAEKNAGRLLAYWRSRKWPLFHVMHNSTNPDSPLVEGKPGNAIHDAVQPEKEEPVIKKNVHSAFIGTNLQDLLEQKGVKKVVIAGLTTDHCVSTTTRMASDLGYETAIVSDASASFDKRGPNGERYTAETIHFTALASLQNEFATVLRTDEIINREEK